MINHSVFAILETAMSFPKMAYDCSTNMTDGKWWQVTRCQFYSGYPRSFHMGSLPSMPQQYGKKTCSDMLRHLWFIIFHVTRLFGRLSPKFQSLRTLNGRCFSRWFMWAARVKVPWHRCVIHGAQQIGIAWLWVVIIFSHDHRWLTSRRMIYLEPTDRAILYIYI